ncbi:hypothetical protein GH714_000289 [Hevea brasiliensis]|uniref:Uncharacterized protein n=1 Tax=Hevea brasiliensis TaxID=3981 RepID=A0A6A6L6G3_HEVBR|nr:hypothetical protein GH714_000289 [Hevea brasiliensis]
MNLVQRLTGSTSSSTYSTSATSSSTSNPFNNDGGAISPAARYATIEKAKTPKDKIMPASEDMGFLEEIGIDQLMERSSGNLFPGILSPGPASLPPITPNFFSPQSDPNMGDIGR